MRKVRKDHMIDVSNVVNALLEGMTVMSIIQKPSGTEYCREEYGLKT